MDTIYIYEFWKSITSDPHGLLLNLSDRINLKRNDNYVALSNLSMYFTWKNIKKSYKSKKIYIYHFQHGMKSLNYLMDDTLYIVKKNYFEYIVKKFTF